MKTMPKSPVSTSDTATGTRYRANIHITLRTSILDPQGKAVLHALGSLGMDSIRDVRIGKYIELAIECGSKADAARLAEEACRKLLANPVMEDYTFTIETRKQ
jgi:phosphoribosylformylglycinamidine synthase subunit PurS